jgi:hypothetical protein
MFGQSGVPAAFEVRRLREHHHASVLAQDREHRL